jgi:NAD(P)H-hydrate epimerase
MKKQLSGNIKLLKAERMRALDGRAINDIGIPGAVLMEEAGRGAVRLIYESVWLENLDDEILLFAGKGNNGGDAFVVARVLLLAGYSRIKVALLAAGADLSGDAKINHDVFINLGGEVLELLDERNWLELKSQISSQKLIVDGLLGTGLKSAVRGLYAEIIVAINEFSGPVLALDIPSGLDADSGLPLGNAVRATATATFAFGKPGLFVAPGCEYAGRVEIVDIGIPQNWAAAEADAIQLLTADFCRELLPETQVSANIHKGSRGHLLTFAGSPGKSGAGLLAATAALHCGCGLSTLALPQSLAANLEGRNPALMLEALPETENGKIMVPGVAGIEKLCAGKNALAIGPGLGLHDAALGLIEILLKNSALPVVLDADALTLLARHPEILPPQRPQTILTPHPGEMARLLQCETKDIQNRRLAAARELALKLGVHVVLKGAGTVVAAPDGSLAINSSGNALLATAGSGDLLTGMIGSLLAQGLEPLAAARAGVFLHGLLADRLLAAGADRGVTVLELEENLPETLSFLAGNAAGN